MDNNTFDLSDRIAVVTGAGTGIGAATARALRQSGARVALLGRRPEPLTALADELGGLAVPTDVSDPSAVASAFDTVSAELGVPDLVVANAGAMLAAPFDTADRAEWERMVAVNLLGLFDTARAAVPGLLAAADRQRRSDLVLISSIGAHVLLPTYSVYVATKAAVSHFSRNLRAELGARGVRVRAIEPGMTESDLGHDMADPAGREGLAEFIKAHPPMPAAAIAEAIVWSSSLPAGVNAAAIEVLPTTQG